MKRTCKTAIVLMLIASVMMLTSCDGMFTHSVMSGAARDPGEAAKALSKKPTSALVDDAGDAADQAQAQAVVGALSVQAKNDPDFASKLDDDQKQTVITAAMTAVIDLTSMANDVDLDVLMNGGDGDDDDMMTSIVDSIINNLGDCDTTCVAAILNDSLDTSGATPTIDPNTSPEMKSSLALGAITVAAATLKGSDFDMDTFMNAMDDSTGDVSPIDVLPNASGDDLTNLTTALNILNALSNDPTFDMSSIFGMGA